MSVSGGNSKEIFELFTNKLVFSVAKMKNQIMILTPISSLDAPLERSASSRIIMKEFLFLFSIWFILLSSNLDIFIMSVSHVFADFRFIFVKCSCSDETVHHCFLYFKNNFIYSGLDCDHFFESVRVKIWSGRTLCHTPQRKQSRGSAEAVCMQNGRVSTSAKVRADGAQRRIWFSN